MTEVYIYPANCQDFTTIGLCGSLTPTSCQFEEVANGLSELTLVHPLDRLKKYQYLQNDCILSVEVPVRTTPEISNGATVRNIEVYTIKTNATKEQRYIYSAASGGSKLRLLSAGEEVTVTSKPETGDRYKVKSGKYSGWLASAALDRETRREEVIPEGAAGIESAVPAWRCRLQLFRIYNVYWNILGSVTVKARHISYDLMYNITKYDTDDEYNLNRALYEIVNQCIDSVPFYFYTNIYGKHTGAHYRDADPITALLDPDNGLCKLWDAKLVRDNNELYLLDNAGLNRGVVLEYGKNLTGVTMTADQSLIATRIRPRGETKDGKPLYLDETAYPDGCVDSPLRSSYPIDRILMLDVPEAKVSSDITTETARQLMVEAANKQYTAGQDKPKISVSVEFDLLGQSEKYADYAALESVYLYDTVGIYHPDLGINVEVDVVRTVWDCLNTRMIAVELGSLQALTSQVSSWQISSGLSGAKLLSGTVDAGKISQDAIATRHLQASSINAEKIQAEAVTAEKISAESLKAQGASIDALQAAWAEITAAYIERLNTGSIETDRLKSALGAFQTMTAGSAYFSEATVRHLISEALTVTDATADKVFISNLAIDYATIVTANVKNLVIGASDGNFYRLDVDPEKGTVRATQQEVSQSERDAGKTEGGKTIIETSITASELGADSLKAVYALINRLDAARIDVDTLTARDAFIDHLRTADISSNASIRIALDTATEAAENYSELRRYMDFTDEGLTQHLPGYIYYTLIDNDGFDVRSTKRVDPIATMNAEDGVKAERFTIGEIACKQTSTGGWVWQ